MKTAVLIAILVAVALLAAFFIFTKSSSPTEQDARKFFLEDLQGKYPAAEVREITEITNTTGTDGKPYFQLKARVTNGLSTPCPERIHVYYDYPPKNFVTQPPEYITKGCKVCINEPVCVLAFPEEAIIASHTYSGAEAVQEFVKSNSDAKAEAAFFENYKDYAGVWLVSWSSASANSSYQVVVSKTQNKVLDVSSG
jgi:hypothetical protein